MLKTRIGSRLKEIREERSLNQSEMAELLNLSSSSYSRIERGESSVDIMQVAEIAEKLGISASDFLPSSFTVNTNNDRAHAGFVIGNVYHYSDSSSAVKEMEKELALKNQEIQFLKEKIEDLEARLARAEGRE